MMAMMVPTSYVCIRDKNGDHWKTLCSTQYAESEVRNMKRHLGNAVAFPAHYRFLDLHTAKIIVEPYTKKGA